MFDLSKRTIFLTVSGSHAYGMAKESSDIDVRGICIPTKEYFHGFLKKFEQTEKEYDVDSQSIIYSSNRHSSVGSIKNKIESIAKRKIHEDEKIDSVIFDFRKFIKLASDCNPNIIELLFSDESSYLKTTSFYQKLFDNRNLFLSMKAKYTFSGYAHSQLKRIKTHKQWLLHPPTHKPTRQEYGLPNKTMIPRDQVTGANALIKKMVEKWILLEEEMPRDMLESVRKNTISAISEIWSNLSEGYYQKSVHNGAITFSPVANPISNNEYDLKVMTHTASVFLGFDSNFIEYLDRERHYKNAITQYNNWIKWKKERNPARVELEKKFGYDTKHASHLVRLLRMAVEIIRDGEVIVKRPDAEELSAIRMGIWSYDELILWADRIERKIDAIYKNNISPLPKAPNRKKIDELCIEIIEEALTKDCLL